MPDNLRKIFRPGRSRDSAPGQPVPAVLHRRRARSDPSLERVDWLRDQPWDSAPVALAVREVPPGRAGAEGIPAGLAEAVNTLSHEIRSPLAAMKSSLNLVLQEETGPLNPDQRHFLAMTMRSIDRLDRLTTDTLDAARAKAGSLALRPRQVDLGPVLAEVAQLHAVSARQAGLDFDASGLPESFEAFSDPDRLRQILDNVLGNAIKYTDAPGRVRLWLQQRPAAGDELMWRVAKACLLPCNLFTVVVEDTGRGMDLQAQRRLFEAFARVHDETRSDTPGSGLGLHITKGLVDAMQGRIRLASRPGQGTTVWIRLPRDRQTVQLAAGAARLQETLDAADAGVAPRGAPVAAPVTAPGLAILDLRRSAGAAAAAAAGRRVVAEFLQAAQQQQAGRGVALTPEVWAAVILDRPRWLRLWADHWTPYRGPDHPEHWQFLPAKEPRPALESVRNA